MPEKYRKKPVVVEAVQWNGENIDEIREFAPEATSIITGRNDWRSGKKHDTVGLTVYTLEGAMNAKVGDFIIKGVNGEFYPCKPDIFKKTYTHVE